MANKLLNQNIFSFCHPLCFIVYYKYIIKEIFFRKEMNMSRKLIIDGNAVYEIDEQCMLRRKLEENAEATKGSSENKKGTANKDMKKD